tara:strand:+ start:136 stop:492 length:357 start_codon:yes stop_codon:yes gene_type:complete
MIQKSLNKYEELKYMKNDLHTFYLDVLTSQMAELNSIYTSEPYSSQDKLKSQYNDTIINSIKFDNVMIKYIIKRSDFEQLLENGFRLLNVATFLSKAFEDDQTEQLAREYIKEQKDKV